MKKTLWVLIFLTCSKLTFFAQNLPDWYIDRGFAFPESLYISATGSGFTQIAAENDALSNLALFFEARVSVIKSSELNVLQKLDMQVEKTRNASTESIVQSEVSLPCVQFTSPHYDCTADDYYVCAYIKKSDAVKELESELSQNYTQARSVLNIAQSSSDPFRSFSRAKAVQKLTVDSSTNLKRLCILDFSKGKEFLKLADELNSKATTLMIQKKQKLSFAVNINGDSDKNISFSVKNIFETQGFVCSVNNPLYLINGEIHFVESEITGVGIFVRPAVSIIVESKTNGEVLGSYTKQLPKYGHKNLDGAYAKANVELEKDLKENLIDSLFE